MVFFSFRIISDCRYLIEKPEIPVILQYHRTRRPLILIPPPYLKMYLLCTTV